MQVSYCKDSHRNTHTHTDIFIKTIFQSSFQDGCFECSVLCVLRASIALYYTATLTFHFLIQFFFYCAHFWYGSPLLPYSLISWRWKCSCQCQCQCRYRYRYRLLHSATQLHRSDPIRCATNFHSLTHILYDTFQANVFNEKTNQKLEEHTMHIRALSL